MDTELAIAHSGHAPEALVHQKEVIRRSVTAIMNGIGHTAVSFPGPLRDRWTAGVIAAGFDARQFGIRADIFGKSLRTKSIWMQVTLEQRPCVLC
ncbi:hypothetical protein E2C01_089993 [Portunus trituberculatus]|uniref:Uncharacterized protein n=1 Tax=Portunus trituberculatus TaxID=210409 RepID=A0A5B7JNX4_PORTR|nr:hypothetical protein [Portunus trituberculatus]